MTQHQQQMNIKNANLEKLEEENYTQADKESEKGRSASNISTNNEK